MPNLNPLDMLLLVSAVVYVAYAISSTHGPFHLFQRLRQTFPLGGVTTCIVCLMPWVSVLLLLLYTVAWGQMIVTVLALSGTALMLVAYTGVRHLEG